MPCHTSSRIKFRGGRCHAKVVYLPGLFYCFDLLQYKREGARWAQRLPRNVTKSSGFVGGVRWLLRCLAYPPRGSQTACFGMAPSCSKFHPRASQKLDWHLPALNFTPAWLTKGMLPWDGTFLFQTLSPRGPHKKHALECCLRALNFTPAWLTEGMPGMLPWKGTFLF